MKSLFSTTNWEDDLEKGEIKRTIVGNTYNYMDSHDDVHIEGIFTKSIQERGDKVLHLADHKYQVTNKVGKPERIYEQKMPWSDLGREYKGDTVALLMDSRIIKEYNPSVFKQYLEDDIDQHSVGMIYVKLLYCVDDKDYKEGFANRNKYRPLVANGEKADEQGYFFAILEAKLKEISSVIEGSNDVTHTIQNGKQEPPGS